MLEILIQLQKGQEEQQTKLDEIISCKKRKRSSSAEDELEDMEHAFETAFRLLKRIKTATSSGSYSNSDNRIHQLAHRHADGLQILWDALEGQTTYQQQRSSNTKLPPIPCPSSDPFSAGKSLINLQDFFWEEPDSALSDSTVVDSAVEPEPAGIGEDSTEPDHLLELLAMKNNNNFF